MSLKLDPATIKLLPDQWQLSIHSLQKRHGCPPEFSVPLLFAVTNFAAQALTKVDPFNWEPTNISEYVLCRNKASGLKTTLMNECMKGPRRFEQTMKLKYEAAIDQYETDLAYFRKQMKLGNVVTRPDKIIGEIFVTPGGTLNGIYTVLKDVPFLGLFNDEAGGLVCNHSLSDPNRAVMFATEFNNLFSGAMSGKLTGMEHIRLDNRAVMMLLMMQPIMADKFLSNETFQQIGFLNRFLVFTVEEFDTPKTVFDLAYKKQLETDAQMMEPFHIRIEEMLNSFELIQDTNYSKDPKMQIRYPNGRRQDELILASMQTSQLAWPVIEAFVDKWKANRKLPQYEEHKEYLGRMQEHLYKISATLATFEKSKEIQVKHINCAAGLLEWFNKQRINVPIVSNNKVVEIADKVIELVKKKGGKMLEYDIVANCRPFKNIDIDFRDKVLAHIDNTENCSVDEISGQKSRVITVK